MILKFGTPDVRASKILVLRHSRFETSFEGYLFCPLALAIEAQWLSVCPNHVWRQKSDGGGAWGLKETVASNVSYTGLVPVLVKAIKQ